MGKNCAIGAVNIWVSETVRVGVTGELGVQGYYDKGKKEMKE